MAAKTPRPKRTRKANPRVEFRVGCSGWSYNHWRGDFYPDGLPQRRWLEHYARHFDTVEVNATFYRLQRSTTVATWRERTPAGFRFAVKASRYLTHMRRLRDAGEPLERFLASVAPLAAKRGPVLFQLPPRFPPDLDLLDAFLRQLPPGLQPSFEFRDAAWWTDETASVLRAHGATSVAWDMAGEQTPLFATAPDIYLRMHGPAATYASGYSDAQLQTWLERLRAAPGVERAWVYFNNDLGGHAPRNATRFRELAAT
jgi:uncharacterized protein YecE (DUF72 family)